MFNDLVKWVGEQGVWFPIACLGAILLIYGIITLVIG
jgi:hypothetical protein